MRKAYVIVHCICMSVYVCALLLTFVCCAISFFYCNLCMLQLFLDKNLVCLLNNRQTRSLVLVREVLSNVCVYMHVYIHTSVCCTCVVWSSK